MVHRPRPTPKYAWRNIFPESGVRYKLFDSGILVILLSFVYFVGHDTSNLKVLARLVNPNSWAAVVIALSIFCVYASYALSMRTLKRGYITIIVVTGFLSSGYFMSIVLLGAGADAFGGALIYGFVCRGMWSEGHRAELFNGR